MTLNSQATKKHTPSAEPWRAGTAPGPRPLHRNVPNVVGQCRHPTAPMSTDERCRASGVSDRTTAMHRHHHSMADSNEHTTLLSVNITTSRESRCCKTKKKLNYYRHVMPGTANLTLHPTDIWKIYRQTNHCPSLALQRIYQIFREAIRRTLWKTGCYWTEEWAKTQWTLVGIYVESSVWLWDRQSSSSSFLACNSYDCVAPYVDIILHRGRFWAKSAASGSVRWCWCCFRSCWTVLSHVMWGRPSCLLQSAWGEANRILLASALSSMRIICPNIYQIYLIG